MITGAQARYFLVEARKRTDGLRVRPGRTKKVLDVHEMKRSGRRLKGVFTTHSLSVPVSTSNVKRESASQSCGSCENPADTHFVGPYPHGQRPHLAYWRGAHRAPARRACPNRHHVGADDRVSYPRPSPAGDARQGGGRSTRGRDLRQRPVPPAGHAAKLLTRSY